MKRRSMLFGETGSSIHRRPYPLSRGVSGKNDRIETP